MPCHCEAVGCTSHSMKVGPKPSFHVFPRNNPERRDRWISALKKLRRDGSKWVPNRYSRICGKHFITGKPHTDPTHPDYVPSIFKHKVDDKAEARMTRYLNAAKRSRRCEPAASVGPPPNISEPGSSVSPGTSAEPGSSVAPGTPGEPGSSVSPGTSGEPGSSVSPGTSGEPGSSVSPGTSGEPGISISPGTSGEPMSSVSFETVTESLMANLRKENDALRAERDAALEKLKERPPPVPVTEAMLYKEISALRAERDEAIKSLKEKPFTAWCVRENDTQCKGCTGLSWIVFMETFEYLSQFLKFRSPSVSPVDQFFLTLVKMRTGLSFEFLSCQVSMCKASVIRIFWTWTDVMYRHLSFLIKHPDMEAVRATLPPVFKRFYPRLTSIVDCFEIFIDQPKPYKARAQTYSHYKKHNTIKVFIACTPLGSVSFVSKAWGGRVSDVELIKRCGYIDPSLHAPRDQILADRGFTVQEDFAVKCGAQLIIPAFTKGKRQLSAQDVEVSRRLASVRIHIERVIGALKNRFRILHGLLPILLLKSMKDEAMGAPVASIDKIITVCAALVNLGDGIVYDNDSQ